MKMKTHFALVLLIGSFLAACSFECQTCTSAPQFCYSCDAVQGGTDDRCFGDAMQRDTTYTLSGCPGLVYSLTDTLGACSQTLVRRYTDLNYDCVVP